MYALYFLSFANAYLRWWQSVDRDSLRGLQLQRDPERVSQLLVGCTSIAQTDAGNDQRCLGKVIHISGVEFKQGLSHIAQHSPDRRMNAGASTSLVRLW